VRIDVRNYKIISVAANGVRFRRLLVVVFAVVARSKDGRCAWSCVQARLNRARRCSDIDLQLDLSLLHTHLGFYRQTLSLSGGVVESMSTGIAAINSKLYVDSRMQRLVRQKHCH